MADFNLIEIEERINKESKFKFPENNGKSFCMVLPPPNITGFLHLGHALMISIQDTIIRWQKMRGIETLWIPGVDHAGISCQIVVEKKLMKDQGITKNDLTRDQFIEEIWKWKNESGTKITSQLKRLGCLLNWEREVFTMDEKMSLAVTEAFCRLYEKNLIYRGTRIVNWCCKLNSVISDDEVDKLELDGPTNLDVPDHKGKYPFGYLWYIKYLVDQTEDYVIVATTRPETIPVDIAVAVNSKDEKYKYLHNKYVINPITGNKIPIIIDDELVDMNFGTGVVKITPAHDQADYESAKRNNLRQDFQIFDDFGVMNENGGPLKGLKRFEARVEALKILKRKKYLLEAKPHKVTLNICSRTGDIIEAIVKPQWYVKVEGNMTQQAIDAVKTGKIKIVPTSYENVWYRWLENIHDWCISRQILWGHRIPAYKDKNTDKWFVGRTYNEALQKACTETGLPQDQIKLEQDPDVLDTWFSSSLYPFSALGWPQTVDVDSKFYPNSLLETGADILFFWVAKMVMMGLELTGKVPFNQVMLHKIVRDSHGRKMSKSLGNVIDPLDVIYGVKLETLLDKLNKSNLQEKELEKARKGLITDYPNGIEQCGTDALRFTLCWYSSQETDISLDVNKIVANRRFCIKLYNAVKFGLLNLAQAKETATDTLAPAEQWIIARLNKTMKTVNDSLENLVLSDAAEAIYHFWLNDLCDVFIEICKSKNRLAYATTLIRTIETALRMTHPFMPFITEELLSKIPSSAPLPTEISNSAELEKEMEIVCEIVHHFCTLRNTNQLNGTQKPVGYISLVSLQQALIDKYNDIITALSKCSEIKTVSNDKLKFIPVKDYCLIAIELIGEVKIDTKALMKKHSRLLEEQEKLKQKMAKPEYNYYCPLSVINRNNKRLEEIETELKMLSA